MNFDLRLPLGLIFSLFGAMLMIDGALSDRSAYARSLGINVNLGWGGVVLLFGLAMLLLRPSGEEKKLDARVPPRNRKAATRMLILRRAISAPLSAFYPPCSSTAAGGHCKTKHFDQAPPSNLGGPKASFSDYMDDTVPKEDSPPDFNKIDLSQLQGFSFGTQWTQDKSGGLDKRDRHPDREDRRPGLGDGPADRRDRRAFRKPMGGSDAGPNPSLPRRGGAQADLPRRSPAEAGARQTNNRSGSLRSESVRQPVFYDDVLSGRRDFRCAGEDGPHYQQDDTAF